MPYDPLFRRLGDKTGGRVVLSDAEGGGLDKLPSGARAGFEEAPLFIDLVIGGDAR